MCLLPQLCRVSGNTHIKVLRCEPLVLSIFSTLSALTQHTRLISTVLALTVSTVLYVHFLTLVSRNAVLPEAFSFSDGDVCSTL